MKKLVQILFAVIVCTIALHPIKVEAAEQISDGLEVTLSVDETSKGEKYAATCTIKNANSYDVKNIYFETKLPEGYAVCDDDFVRFSLNAGEEKSFQVAFIRNLFNEVAKEEVTESKHFPAWIWIVILISALVIVIATVLVILYKKGIRLFSILLIISLISSLLVPGVKVNAAETARKTSLISCDFSVGKEKQQVSILYHYDYNPDADLLRIDTSDFGYDNEENTYAIHSKLDGIKGYLKNPENYSRLSLEVLNSKGVVVSQYEIFPSEEWCFKQVGLFVGRNKIVVKAEGDKPLVSELYLRDIWGYNYEYVNDADKDSDSDGLFDTFELYLGTDISKIDTDEDGLTDYQEACELGTDPLNTDTDQNGISDYDEDQDGDGLSNGKEYSIGTSPIMADSDFDGLSDADEIEIHKTDPTKEDTDEDGADDGWEIANGFDPLKYNKKFDVAVEPNEITETRSVTAGVNLTAKGAEADIDSISVKPISTYDSPFISPMVAGYLGDAYEFSIDGEFEEAELVFKYDEELGEIGDDFQPRIYYFNEENKSFEELENQIVERGIVRAKTKHFSQYALLNKTVFDRALESSLDFMPEDKDKILGANSMVFVFDTSASMAISDTDGVAKDTAKYIVGKVRAGFDVSSVISYTKKADILLTSSGDVRKTIDVIESMGYDNGLNSYSGTDGVNALGKAIEVSTNSPGKFKYIFFFTDGKDTESRSYQDIESEAVKCGIKIYTIGIGEVNSNILSEIATKTEGKFISESYKSNLDEVLSEIILTSTDSNKDGINDYFTKLIYEGKLLLSNGSNELAGIDLTYNENGEISDDYDGDGLKNGEEISVTEDGKRVYVEMRSNPLMLHSDGDGIDDLTEVNAGSDPMRFSVEKKYVDILTNSDSGYYYENYYKSYKESNFHQGFTFVVGGIFGVWNKDELYRDLIIDYYNSYATLETLEEQELQEQKKIWSDYTASFLKGLKTVNTKSTEWYNDIRKMYKLWSYINGVTKKEQIDSNFINQIVPIVSKWNSISEEARQIRCDSYGLEYVSKLLTQQDVQKYVTKSTEVLDKAAKITGWISYGVDIADSINELAKVNANNKVFQDNIDELDYLITYSTDDHAKDAARMIRSQLAGNYGNMLIAAIQDTLELGTKHIIKAAAKANIYFAAVVAVRDVTDILFGISDDIKQEYKMLCYHEMSAANAHYVRSSICENGIFYEIATSKVSDYYRYMVHLSQIRILGERQFYEWQDCDGWLGFIGDWIVDINSVKENVNSNIAAIKTIADWLGLILSSNMKYEV